MKLIPQNTTIGIISDYENINYPISNVLNNSPKKKWISSSIVEQTITISVKTGSQAISFFNILNISNLTLASLDAFNIEWGGSTLWGGSTEWGFRTNPNIYFDIDVLDDNSLWIDFDYQLLFGIDILITITPNFGDFPSIGIISSGEVFKTDDPAPGWSYGFNDYSIITELSNGSFDSRNRDTVRTFSGSFLMLTSPDFFNFSYLVRNIIKSNPAAWFFSSNKNETEYLIYGRFVNMPSAEMTSISKSNKSNVDISIIEEV